MRRAFRTILTLGFASCFGWFLLAAEPTAEELRDQAAKAYQDGNFKDAYEMFHKLLLDPECKSDHFGHYLGQMRSSLQRLNRQNETDTMRQEFLDVHGNKWQAVYQAAVSLKEDQHYGAIIAGEFYRGGQNRGGGEWVDASERDRVQSLRWLRDARQIMQKLAKSPTMKEYESVARSQKDLMLWNRQGQNAWKLQILTDLEDLPDYDKQQYGYGRGWGGNRQPPAGAPVDEDGNPVLYAVPESYETATSDGLRWRFLMNEIVTYNPGAKAEMQYRFASFLHEQFGVQTMAGQIAPQAEPSDDPANDESNPYAVSSLKDTETIAKLATGIKRFTLLEEFNFITIYQKLAEEKSGGYSQAALPQLAQIFTNRRQFPKAAATWRTLLDRTNLAKDDFRWKAYEQIVGNWGRLEPVGVFPAGTAARVPFRFRNAEKVTFTAHRLDVEQLLTDVKNAIKKAARGDKRIDWQTTNLNNLSQRIINENEKKYKKEQVAEWSVALDPLDEHRDLRKIISTPLKSEGAYLLEADIMQGNQSRLIVWISDLAIVKKNTEGTGMLYVADAVSGQPVEQANVEFFGFRTDHQGNQVFKTTFAQFAKLTDQNGMIVPEKKLADDNMQWMYLARKGGRFAFLNWDYLQESGSPDAEPSYTKIYVTTDRPVYRPGDKVKFKFWVRTPSYGPDAKDPGIKQSATLQISTPRGEKILDKQITTDAFGGYAGEIELEGEAQLGQYTVSVHKNGTFHGTGNFRVEEYKKPEYEVTIDAPSEPVQLGEKIPATIEARYYFGAPVTKATVHYKVTRTKHDSRWFPHQRWDWFYEPGYWWFGYDYTWYPGWKRWGCLGPIAPWWGWSPDPPEVVMEADAEIGPDGKVTIEIDTALAKAVHSDQDHKYEITAEVVDESRRTIVGQGSVLVAREPFKVFVWPNRGYYNEGDTAEFSFKAQTLDQKPVQGTGTAKLFKVTYDEQGVPKENEVETWNVDPDVEGSASLKVHADAAGQYRLSYTVTDAKKNEIEGAYVFTIRGGDTNPENFRFNELELIVEKKEYQPGEKVKLLINSNHENATVLLFPRSSSGVSSKPVMLKLEGKSTVYELDVTEADRPNIFVEALTIFDAKVHTQAREIIVPPAKKIINVAVESEAEEYLPGKDATLKVKFTNEDGTPFVGSTILAVYDKAVEYISGGSNVSDIREFFWKWRRHYSQQHSSSLARYFYAVYRNNEQQMVNLGIFGDILDQDYDEFARDWGTPVTGTPVGRPGPGGGYGFFGDGPGPGVMPMAAAEMQMDGAGLGAPMRKMAAAKSAPGDSAGPTVEPTVRSNFADTAYWSTEVKTDSEGHAEVKFSLPDSLTTWKTRVWTMGSKTEVGEGTTEFVARKNVLVRLQAPRFFTETDEVILSANVHNYLKEAKEVQVVLELDGGQLTPLDDLLRTVTVPADGEIRVDWKVKAVEEGEVTIRVKALTDAESDAMEVKFPVYVHGMLKTESYTGVIRPDAETAQVALRVPEDRRPAESRLEVRYSPTLAGAMVDALPYLVDYPYGCTEQTLNRFVPTVITQGILKKMNLDLKAIQEKRTNLNAQEIGDDQKRAERWKRFDRNPVFDEAEVTRMVDKGVQKLTEMQLSDGGWGWFSGRGEHSAPHTTAVVVHGLQLAQQNGMAIVPDTLNRGVEWLKGYQNGQVELLKIGDLDEEQRKKRRYKTRASNLDALVFMVLVDAGHRDETMENYLYRDRVELSLYAKAMFGLALHKVESKEKLAMILENLSQFVVEDEENETAYLNDQTSFWWYWYGSGIEGNAFYLKLLAKTDPKGVTTSRLVKYLLNNRKHATYWNSTRDTAYAIEALAEFIVASEEIAPDMTVEVWLDGKKHKEVKIDRENLFSFDNKLVLTGDEVSTGEHTLELKRTGKGPVYFNAYLTNFTLEDFITKAGLEVKVQRKYYKLTRDDREGKVASDRGQAVGQKEERYVREELANLASLASGTLVEIELEIDSKNDYEYLVFEDFKAAGFEPVTLQSGYVGSSLGAYMELRDEKVAFFVRSLPRGKHSVSYRMRAEIPGKFSALPTVAEAMYAPELRGNSDEIKLQITEREE